MSGSDKKKLSLTKLLLSQKESGAVIPLAILIIAVAFVNQNFFSTGNLMDVLRTASFWVIIGVAVSFLFCAGGFDLSIGAATSMGGVVCGQILKSGLPPIPALLVGIIAALLTGMLIGFINGTCVVRFKLPGFIFTLGMQYCLNGIINVWTKGLSITNFDTTFTQIGQYRFFKTIPIPIVYALIIAIVGHILMTQTKFGRKVLAVGGNAETARLAGINVEKTQIATYIAVSTMATLVGVLYGARFATVQPAIGTGSEMNIIAAVIVGGTSSTGGVGTIVGTVLGCILLAMITNVLIMLGISAYWQSFVFGLILVVSLFIDRYRRKALNA